MAAYMIVEVETTDEALMAEYRKHTPGAIAKFGGKFIVRGGKTSTWKAAGRRRASWCSNSPTMQAAEQFYYSANTSRCSTCG